MLVRNGCCGVSGREDVVAVASPEHVGQMGRSTGLGGLVPQFQRHLHMTNAAGEHVPIMKFTFQVSHAGRRHSMMSSWETR